MATIYQEKATGDWYANWRYNGKRYRVKAGKTKREAELFLKGVNRRLAIIATDPVFKPSSLQRFVDFLLDWIPRHKSPRTAERYLEVLNHFKAFVAGKRLGTLADIRPRHIEEYKTYRLQHVKPGTVAAELTILGLFWRVAIDLEFAKENPVSQVARPAAVPKTPRYLSKEEIAALLDASSPYERAVWTTYLLTGMRRGELESLRWKDIDLKGRTITLEMRSEWQPKGRRSRGVPLHPDLVPVLKKLPRKSNELVFATRNGTRLKHFDRNFKRCAAKAGISGASIHTLRHTAASHLVMAGVDLATVGNILGHRDITTTMVYAHLASDHLQSAIARLDLSH